MARDGGALAWAACGGVAVAWWWTQALACALLCAVAGDNGAGMDAAAQGGALARDCVFGDWLLT